MTKPGPNMDKILTGVTPRNRLLEAFADASRARVEPYLERVECRLGDVVCEAGGLLNFAYFPDGAVLSLLTVLDNGAAIETANIGREGAFGLSAMYSRVSFNRSLVQLQGGLLRVPMKVLQSEFEKSAHVRNLFVSYSETLLAQIQQTVACNSMHTIQERMCRWLLMMHDRTDGADLVYTHEFLAAMMGINRKSVTLAAQAMQRAGFIDYRRGRMQVLDRPGLENAACECYAIVSRRFDAFLTPPPHAVQSHSHGRIKPG
ncbi:MAG: Crp/Fnr family transcriptional regulator [Methylocella sp.]